MARLRLFSKQDKKAMKKLRDETMPSIIPKPVDCPNCGAGCIKGNYCYDCGSSLTTNNHD